MRATTPIALVVVVTLAGCGGVFGDGEGTATLTPAAVPTEEPTPTPVPRLAPGLTREGVRDAGALAAAHDAALDGRSFTVRRTRTYRTGTGMPVRQFTSVTRVAGDGRFRITRRWTGETTLRREASYFDGERLLVAATVGNETNYRRAPPSSVRSEAVAGTGGERIERVFTAAETRVARSDRDGRTVYRLVPAANGSDERLDQSVSVRARITASGLVRSYTLDQRLSEREAGDASAIVVATRYGAVGSTAVERPSWYGEAMAATNGTTRTGPKTT